MGEYAAEPQDRTAAEAKFSSEQLETGSTPQICCQPASRFKNETTFSLITSFLQFRYLNFFLVGHPVVRFARQENGRKYLQSSAISKCPLSFGRLEVKGFALTVNKYFDLNVRLFLSLSMLAVVVPYQQDNNILPNPFVSYLKSSWMGK